MLGLCTHNASIPLVKPFTHHCCFAPPCHAQRARPELQWHFSWIRDKDLPWRTLLPGPGTLLPHCKYHSSKSIIHQQQFHSHHPPTCAQFPRKLQYVEFSSSSEGGSRNTVVNAWSRDGQEILLEMGFYFQVVPDTLAALFYEYTEDGYLPVIEDIATNTFRVSTHSLTHN